MESWDCTTRIASSASWAAIYSLHFLDAWVVMLKPLIQHFHVVEGYLVFLLMCFRVDSVSEPVLVEEDGLSAQPTSKVALTAVAYLLRHLLQHLQRQL